MASSSPSMADIARRAGVSKATVSMALRNHPRISEAQRGRIQALASRMGYCTNTVVSRLMVELRKSRKTPYLGTLALVNASSDRDLLQRYVITGEWKKGVQDRANSLGYSLDYFWLREAGMTPARLLKILQTRNVLGVVFHNLDVSFPVETLEPIWSYFPCISPGRRLENPALYFVVNDQYDTVFQASRRVTGYGYQRPGLVIPESLDYRHNYRFSSGYFGFMRSIEREPVPSLYLQSDPKLAAAGDHRADQDRLYHWLEREKPDVVLAINSNVLDWLREAGLKLPRDMGYVLLDLPQQLRDRVAGMEQQQYASGAAAVDMLAGQILQRENGLPSVQKSIMLESRWRDGATLRKHH